MADEIKRLHYFDHQFLRVNDFEVEQDYHLGMRRRHNRLLHTWGIADGLTLEYETGASVVTVRQGTAINGKGEEIVLTDDKTLELSGFAADTDVYITVAYDQKEDEYSQEVEGQMRATRWTEEPLIEPVTDEPTDESEKLILGKVLRTGTEVTGIDETKRRDAGVVAGDLQASRLTLTIPGADSSLWPSLAGGAEAKSVVLDGDLNIAESASLGGDLTVDGTVDGRDIAADAQILTEHLAATDNPHHTSAAHVGAPVSVDGVSNPGGNIDLNTAGAITINASDAANRITIGENHSTNKANPHEVTAGQAGALSTAGGSLAGNLTVGGNLGVGVGSPQHRLHILAGDEPERRTYGLVSTSQTGPTANSTYGMNVEAGTSGNGGVWGLNVSASGSGTGAKYGVFSNVFGSGSKFGGYFYAASGEGSYATTALYGSASSSGDGRVRTLEATASSSGDGTAQGLYANVTSSGAGNVDALTAYAGGTGSGLKRGIYCSATGGGNKLAGNFYASSGEGTDATNGISISANTSGDGSIQGIYLNANATGDGSVQGMSMNVNSTGEGSLQGLNVSSHGAGTGYKYGVICNVGGGGSKQAGYFSANSGEGSDQSTGIAAYAQTSGDGNVLGLSASASSSGEGGADGINVYASGQGTGHKRGLYCAASGKGNKTGGYFYASSGEGTDTTNGIGISATTSGDGFVRGMSMNVSSTGEGGLQGLSVSAYGDGTGDKYGVISDLAGGGSKQAGYFSANSGEGSDSTLAIHCYASSAGDGEVRGLNISVSGNGEGNKYGIYSRATGEGQVYAGYFQGNVHVAGILSKASGAFLIDHPLDPYNKTLRHNFVESPENLCIYRGKVKLNAKGQATVRMPAYFAELTREEEATISLTSIGGKPFLTSYDWKDKNTAFTISGEAGAEVSYVVFADRDDPAANHFRRPVEEKKGDGNFVKGELIHPQAYGEAPKADEPVEAMKPPEPPREPKAPAVEEIEPMRPAEDQQKIMETVKREEKAQKEELKQIQKEEKAHIKIVEGVREIQEERRRKELGKPVKSRKSKK